MNAQPSTIVFLSLGSNQGDRIGNLDKSIELIEYKCGKILNISSIYETAPWGNTDQDVFLNQVVEISTDLSPLELLDAVLQIEEKLGRVRLEHWGPRLIDIDILFYGNQVIDEQNLSVPHIQIQHRNFVLVPFNEIAPDWFHPKMNMTIQEILDQQKDGLEVRKLERR